MPFYPNDQSPSEIAAKDRLATRVKEFDPDEWPAADAVVTDFTENGDLRMAIPVKGWGVLVLRAVPVEPTAEHTLVGRMEFKGASSFTNAEIGWWENG